MELYFFPRHKGVVERPNLAGLSRKSKFIILLLRVVSSYFDEIILGMHGSSS